MTLNMPVEDGANELLSRSPLALLVAMLLDQQVPFEKAFGSPYQLALRLDHEPTVTELAAFDPEALAAVFSERPALHRFPKAMAARVQDLARLLLARYDGDAEQVWASAGTGAQLRDNLAELPGYGPYKAQITMALLGKQFGIQPEGWREAAGPFGHEGSYVSVADITDEESLARVRAYKKQAKAAGKAAAQK
jgi:uncharacterized HhH-GPD family protein